MEGPHVEAVIGAGTPLRIETNQLPLKVSVHKNAKLGLALEVVYENTQAARFLLSDAVLIAVVVSTGHHMILRC